MNHYVMPHVPWCSSTVLLANRMTLTYARSSPARATTKKGRSADVAQSHIPAVAACRRDSAGSPAHMLALDAGPSTSSDCVDAEHLLRRRSAGDLWCHRIPGASSSPVAGRLAAAERSRSVASSRWRRQPCACARTSATTATGGDCAVDAKRLLSGGCARNVRGKRFRDHSGAPITTGLDAAPSPCVMGTAEREQPYPGSHTRAYSNPDTNTGTSASSNTSTRANPGANAGTASG